MGIIRSSQVKKHYNLSKTFVQAVKGVDLCIEKGDFIWRSDSLQVDSTGSANHRKSETRQGCAAGINSAKTQ